jgi:hypothetical protein
MDLRLYLVAAILATGAFAQPKSAFETAAMKEARSLADSAAAAPLDLRTLAEISNFERTGDYAECIAFYRQLAARSLYARLVPVGKTGEGLELYVLIVSKDRTFTPQAAARTGKPVVLLQNGIHAGENGGKDAAMLLLRDVLVSKKFAGWLDHVILLSIPVFNADGHEHRSPYNRINENGPAEMGFRVTSQRLNLNRDYMKADAPEMRAWLALYSTWLPELLIDNHVTDGSDYQWDVTIATHTEGDIAAPMGRWVKESYLPALLNGMEQLGHLVGWYYEGRSGDALNAMTASPRYSTGYAAARGRAALLVETHSLKPFRTRVWSHYDIMRTSIDTVAANAAALKQASRDADRWVESLKPGERVMLEGRPGTRTESYTLRQLVSEKYRGEAAGGEVVRYTSEPVDRPALLNRSLVPSLEVAAPLGYLIPRQWAGVIGVLRAHGVKMEELIRPLTAEFDTLRFEKVEFATRPFEGRFQVTRFESRQVREKRTFPAGSVFVPVSQQAGRLIMDFLEPETVDSALKWGYFESIFEQKEYFSDYIFEPIAEQMLRQNAQLRADFDAKLKDETFAKNPRARLMWLFQRSPYFEPDKDAYPVVRVDKKNW